MPTARRLSKNLDFHQLTLSRVPCQSGRIGAYLVLLLSHINSSLQCSPWSQKVLKPYDRKTRKTIK